MDKKSKITLAVAILFAVGGAMIAAPAGWESLLTPSAVGGVLTSLAGALMAAYGVKVQ